MKLRFHQFHSTNKNNCLIFWYRAHILHLALFLRALVLFLWAFIWWHYFLSLPPPPPHKKIFVWIFTKNLWVTINFVHLIKFFLSHYNALEPCKKIILWQFFLLLWDFRPGPGAYGMSGENYLTSNFLNPSLIHWIYRDHLYWYTKIPS